MPHSAPQCPTQTPPCQQTDNSSPPLPWLQAFTKCTQHEPDNGEAWNNIAALWTQLERPREAFSAACEATKHKRGSWQTWENYAHAALQSGALQQACRGLAQVRAAGVGWWCGS